MNNKGRFYTKRLLLLTSLYLSEKETKIALLDYQTVYQVGIGYFL